MKPLILILLTLFSLSLFQLSFAEIDTVEQTNRVIRLATTTSTDNSGLLAYLVPEFENKTGYRIHVIAVGTGKALRMGSDGDADVLLVHAPSAELGFIRSGYGVKRHPVMYNDFVLVGPDANPANIKIDDGISEALRQIADSNAHFISRGDNSGTHKKELTLWQSININPDDNWYREVGQGMGKVLQMAAELDAYTLTDRGTWLAYQDKSPLRILNEGDSQLYNPYHIIAVSPQRFPGINYQGANALISWITSTDGQALIAQFRRSNTLLFKPTANVKQLAKQTSEK